MNTDLFIWVLIITVTGAIVYLVTYLFSFKPNKYSNHEHNQLNFEKFKYAGNFIKWIITGIIVYALGAYVNDTFKNREVGIEEMKQYDTYVNTVLGKDLETKKAYALYYSIITPNDTLKRRWRDYLDTLNIGSAALQQIAEKLTDSSISVKERRQLLRQSDSIKSNLQIKQPSTLNSESESTLYRIDIIFYDIENYASYPLNFQIYNDGYPVFTKSFEAYHFLQIGMNGSRTETIFYTETKDDLKIQSLHLEIPGKTDPNKIIKIKCDFKFYFYNGTNSVLKNQEFDIVPGSITLVNCFITLSDKKI